MLSRDAYLARLSSDVVDLSAILATADLASPVPSCPGWDLADLASHLGGVHRWAHGIVTTGSPGEEPVGPRERAALVAWFDEGAAQLIDALRDVDPDAPTWTLGPRPRTASFWVRRQPHETSVHLGDARRALGLQHAVDPDFAADGVDEVVTMFTPRQVRLERISPLPHTVRLELTDTSTSYLLGSPHDGDDGDDGAADAVVAGRAQDVLEALWRRLPLDDLEVRGDAAAAHAVFALALTP